MSTNRILPVEPNRRLLAAIHRTERVGYDVECVSRGDRIEIDFTPKAASYVNIPRYTDVCTADGVADVIGSFLTWYGDIYKNGLPVQDRSIT